MPSDQACHTEECYEVLRADDFNKALDASARSTKRYPQLRTMVERTPTELILRNASGMVIATLKNVQDKASVPGAEFSSNYTSYSFKGYLELLDAYSIEQYFYEGYGHLIVPLNGKAPINLTSYPVVSPDAKHFAVANSDLEAGYEDSGLWLYAYQEGEARLVWSVISNEEGTIHPEWIGPDELMSPARAHVLVRVNKKRGPIFSSVTVKTGRSS